MVARQRAGRGEVASRVAADVACAVVLGIEVLGSVVMWAPVPLAWFWVGARVYVATESLAAGAGVAFAGFVATTILVMVTLARVDRAWVALRRRAGHDQAQGALTQVVVVSATFGLIGFVAWYYVLGDSPFVLPFMPTQ